MAMNVGPFRMGIPCAVISGLASAVVNRRILLLSALLVATLRLAHAGSVTGQTPGQHDDADRASFLSSYVGRYQLTERFFLDITRVGDALYVQATGQQRAQLRPRSETVFVIVGTNLRLVFGFGPLSDEVDHLIFEQAGLGRRAEKRSADEIPPARTTITVPSDVLARYVGTYQEQPGFAITISLQDGQLMAGMSGQGVTPIVPESATEFVYETSSARLSFDVPDNGRAVRLILHQGVDEVAMDRIGE